MAELGFRMGSDITLNLLPIVVVVTNVLAVRADGQKALQELDLSQSLFQFRDSSRQRLLQREQAKSDLQARPQFARIKGLDM